MQRLVLAAILPLIALSSPADGTGVPREDRALAAVDGRVIHERDFVGYLESGHSTEEAEAILENTEMRKRALDDFLGRVSAGVSARRAGIDREANFKKAAELMELKILSRAASERGVEERIRQSRVSDAEVLAYYEEHKQEYVETPRFTAHQLVVYVKGNPAFPKRGLSDAAARARSVAASGALRSGMSWEAAVEKYSDEAAGRRGGLLRDMRYELVASEVAAAIKTQPIGSPGEPVRSVFGWHVIEVVSRVTEATPKPFSEVKKALTERLVSERTLAANEAFMEPLRHAMHLMVTEAGHRDGPLFDGAGRDAGTVLATLDGESITEEAFQWFLKDALLPSQRRSADARPGARQGMFRSYLDMRVLADIARSEGLDTHPEILRELEKAKLDLLVEFIQQREGAAPSGQCGGTSEAFLARAQEDAGLVRLDNRNPIF